jgi:hypothetical protein
MNKTNKFSPEVRERAVRMVQEHRGEYASLWAAVAPISAYDVDRERVAKAIVGSVQKAPGPGGVAATIVDAAFSGWAMRRTPKGEASLLQKLRRFMPASPVDASLRKTFGLG